MPRNLYIEVETAKAAKRRHSSGWQNTRSRNSTCRIPQNVKDEYMRVVPWDTITEDDLDRLGLDDIKLIIKFSKKMTKREDCLALLESVFAVAANTIGDCELRQKFRQYAKGCGWTLDDCSSRFDRIVRGSQQVGTTIQSIEREFNRTHQPMIKRIPKAIRWYRRSQSDPSCLDEPAIRKYFPGALEGTWRP